MIFGSPLPKDEANQWRHQLNQFVKENERDLAALAWGLLQEWGNSQEALGIDLNPKPHFVCCTRESLEELNQKLESKIQEVLGILDKYNRDEEVAIVGIGKGQIKLIYFKPDPTPPLCFEAVETDLDSLIQKLEKRMEEMISYPV
ncbi:conserved hypothetical protein [Gloeothece citriformis PCC 7424]|uniref:Chaperone protein CcmS domain-containing protein n=1 Tax=Gloeothece citriformis (strain PCC 7424) TaxID=65393 RepID=B7KBT1_GLOC7|nr:hypothetical protein [Gloeothece citriformis]ACK73059.1 conserved hypothetical protein [Gloeothece citriformis PCC 7424]